MFRLKNILASVAMAMTIIGMLSSSVSIVEGAKTREDFIVNLPDGQVCVEGYIMDKYCIETLGYLLDRGSGFPTLERAEEHSYHCLLDVGVCVSSGYEVLSSTRECDGDLYCRLVTLDKNGFDLVTDLAQSERSKGKGVRATVIGTIEDNPSDDPPVLQVSQVLTSSVGCSNPPTMVTPPTEAPVAKPTLQPTSAMKGDIIIPPDDTTCAGLTHRFALNDNYQLSYKILVDDPDTFQDTELPNGNMTVELVLASGAGWVGFGIPHSPPMMVVSDAVIGVPPDNDPARYDLTQRSDAGVNLAASQEGLFDHSLVQNDTHTVMKFTTRLIQEGRTGTIDVNGPNTFIWAHGSGNQLIYHAERGSFDTQLQVCQPGVGLIDPPVAPTEAPVEVAKPTLQPTSAMAGDVIIPPGDTTCTGLTHRFALDNSYQLSYKILADDPDTFQDSDSPNGNMTVELVLARGAGWVGFGIPHSPPNMVVSDAVIGVPPDNDPARYDLTQRNDAGVNLAASQEGLFDHSLVQNDTHTVMKFTMRLVQEGRTGNIDVNGPNTFIWAYGSGNQLAYHAARGNFVVQLQVCQPGVGLIGEGGFVEGEVAGSKRSFFEVHGILNTIAWGLITPLAISSSLLRKLFIRCTGSIKLWFYCHMGLNLLSLVLSVVAFALAVSGVNQGTVGNATHFTQNTPHTMAGLVIFILIIAQCMNGLLRPHLPPPPSNEPYGDKDVDAQENSDDTDYDDANNNSGRQRASSRKHSGGLSQLQSSVVAAKNDEEEQPVQDRAETPTEGKSVIRKVWEIAHKIVGVGLLAISWWQIYTGWDLYSEMFAEDNRINLLWGFIGGVGGLLVVLYIFQSVAGAKKE